MVIPVVLELNGKIIANGHLVVGRLMLGLIQVLFQLMEQMEILDMENLL